VLREGRGEDVELVDGEVLDAKIGGRAGPGGDGGDARGRDARGVKRGLDGGGGGALLGRRRATAARLARRARVADRLRAALDGAPARGPEVERLAAGEGERRPRAGARDGNLR
jgi:hypothetical protein